MAQTVIDTICSSYDTFFDSEKKIAKYIIDHYDEVVEMTVGQLAQASKASEASVSRFCRRIGMKGFHHLKISLAKEMVDSGFENMPISNRISIENVSQSLQNILANKIEELRQTVSMIDENEFYKIMEILYKARSVAFVAVGNTIPVAIDGAFKFNQVGKLALSSTIWETQIGMICNLTQEDAVIVISNSGESSHGLCAVQTAKEKQIPTIAITNSPTSSIAKSSDYHITTATREKLFLDGYCFSRVSATAVVEMLYLFLASMIEDSYEKIANHENKIAGNKL